jgi:hypothetical protein
MDTRWTDLSDAYQATVNYWGEVARQAAQVQQEAPSPFGVKPDPQSLVAQLDPSAATAQAQAVVTIRDQCKIAQASKAGGRDGGTAADLGVGIGAPTRP